MLLPTKRLRLYPKVWELVMGLSPLSLYCTIAYIKGTLVTALVVNIQTHCIKKAFHRTRRLSGSQAEASLVWLLPLRRGTILPGLPGGKEKCRHGIKGWLVSTLSLSSSLARQISVSLVAQQFHYALHPDHYMVFGAAVISNAQQFTKQTKNKG